MKLRRCIAAGIAALLIFVAVFYAFYLRHSGENVRHVLEIRDSVSGRLFWRQTLEEEGEFSIEFIHSVNKSPVRETFAVDKGMIKLLSVRFSSFGAGIRSDLGDGLRMERHGDEMVIAGFSSSFRELRYIVGTFSDHLLFLGGETFSLRELCGRNAQVVIAAK